MRKAPRRLALALLPAALLIGGTALARQDDTDREAARAELVERLEEAARRLELTDQQREQITPIFEEFFRGQLAILEQHGVDLEARASGRDRSRISLRRLRALRGDLDENTERTDEKLAVILSATQMEELRRMREEQRAERRELLRSRR